MTRVLYVSLDDRACNYEFPNCLAELTEDIELLRPPYEYMGFLKKAADVDKIWDWVLEQASACSYAIMSVDMLVYGNLVNSRTHSLTLEQCMERLERFRILKAKVPSLEIHAFNLVARVAAYDNNFEDPDYWSEYGYRIWRYTCLLDKEYRGQITAEEQKELKEREEQIPGEHLADFLRRREVDRAVNLKCVDLLSEGVFELLTVPKDDTSEYGMAAIDSAHLFSAIRERGVENRFLSHPGADEVGSVLFARIFCRSKQFVPKILPRYSSVNGPYVIPKYEDRPLHESVKWQVTSLGGIVCDSAAESDCLLAINATGTTQVEAAEQEHKIDAAFRAAINIPEFLNYISYYQSKYNRAVGLAEVSCCNGCENLFTEMAEKRGLLSSVDAFGGWNTAQNTIGVVLAHTVIAAYYDSFAKNEAKKRLSESFKIKFILSDWRCQANLTPQYRKEIQREGKIDPYRLRGDYDQAREWYRERLQDWLDDFIKKWYPDNSYVLTGFRFNWDSIFFIDMELRLGQREE